MTKPNSCVRCGWVTNHLLLAVLAGTAFAQAAPPAGSEALTVVARTETDQRLEAKVRAGNAGAVHVREIQQLLSALGYDVGAPDGILGRKTREALTEWNDQRAEKLDLRAFLEKKPRCRMMERSTAFGGEMYWDCD